MLAVNHDTYDETEDSSAEVIDSVACTATYKSIIIKHVHYQTSDHSCRPKTVRNIHKTVKNLVPDGQSVWNTPLGKT